MTITSEHLGNLRGLIKFASPLPWQWATSNSTARLSSASGKDGDVVSAFRATDGVPCVNVSSDNMNLIASAVNYLPELLAHIDAQAEQVDSLKTQLSIAAERAGINFDRAEAAEKLAEFRGQNLLSVNELIAGRDKRIAEQQAVIDQRNGECDRLINELAALREQKPLCYITPDTVKAFHCGYAGSATLLPDTRSIDPVPLFMRPVPPAPVAVPDEIINVASRLVDRYLANKNTKLEFICCVTPERSSIGTGGVWDDWKSMDSLLRLNSGSKPLVVTLPQRLSPEGYHIDEAYMENDEDGEYLDRDEVIAAIRAAGGEIAE